MAQRIGACARRIRCWHPRLPARAALPEIYEMQVRAIVRAALAVEARSHEVPLVEIMHPLVGFAEELRRLRETSTRSRRARGPGARSPTPSAR